MNTHTCIKPNCGTQYESTDVDAYYCKNCYKEKREVAKKVDAKFAGQSRAPIKTALQEYDEAPKFHGFPKA